MIAIVLLAASTLACLNPTSDSGSSGDKTSDVLKPSAPKASRSSPKIEGKILYASQGTIWVWSGSSATKAIQGDAYAQPCWAPSEERFVFVQRGNSFSDLVIGSTGGDQVKLTNNQPSRYDVGSLGYAQNSTWALDPVWSPDGQTIAYVSDWRTSDMRLWSIAAGGGEPQRLAVVPAGISGIDRLSWSPDGKTIAAALSSQDSSQIWTFDLANQNWTQFTDNSRGAYDPAWSPDGQRLAFAGRDQYGTDIWLARPDGGEVVQVTTNGESRSPAWSPDGKYLAFVTEKDGSFDIWVVGVSTTAEGITSVTGPQQVTENAMVDAASGLSWSN